MKTSQFTILTGRRLMIFRTYLSSICCRKSPSSTSFSSDIVHRSRENEECDACMLIYRALLDVVFKQRHFLILALSKSYQKWLCGFPVGDNLELQFSHLYFTFVSHTLCVFYALSDCPEYMQSRVVQIF